MTPQTMAEALQRIDRLQAEVAALSARSRKHWQKAEDLRVQLEDAKAQAKLSDQTCSELIRMIDALRSERDTYRAQASL